MQAHNAGIGRHPMSMSSERSWIMLTSCEQRGGERPTDSERARPVLMHLSLQQQQRASPEGAEDATR